jgi:hypothetical protein
MSQQRLDVLLRTMYQSVQLGKADLTQEKNCGGRATMPRDYAKKSPTKGKNSQIDLWQHK